MARKTLNEDLARERSQSSFNVVELTQLLDGSEEKTIRRKELEKEYYDDPELNDMAKLPIDYLSNSEIYDVSLKKSLHIFHKAINMADPQEILTVADAVLHEASPVTVHFVMFIPALMGMASEEQQSKWLPLALEMKMIGSYAQTELGHGTFLRGLQTTATYDPKTEEFILNTPTLSSIKWWPGSLGKTANHAVVLAQLWTDGKCHGIHPFMVQLRSMEDHQPLPGITVGEIGPKMGMRASDNGFLKMDNIRIPRENMFMKNAQVTKEGKYMKPKSDKLNYGTMVFVRVLVIDYVAFNLARAVTIATRYSAIRRQSEIIPGSGKEDQILDYQAQQYKILPALALCHALKASFLHLMTTYKNFTQAMDKGDLATLPELHAMSSGIKGLATDLGSRAIEVCRLACGGHGYLLISGLPRLYASTVAACTYEGENTVLYMQTARYLMKVLRGEVRTSPSSIMAYILADQPTVLTSINPSNFTHLLDIYQAAAYKLVHDANKHLQATISSGVNSDVAWNMNQVHLIRAAKAHILYSLSRRYCEWLNDIQVSPPLRVVLNRLCNLFLCYNIGEMPGAYLLVGLSESNLSRISAHVIKMLTELRPDAVGLVDAFDFHDLVLNSALGCYDGNVYERMFQWAQKTPLNKTQVHESYYKYLQPVMKSNI